jgi:multidrug efflux pump
MTTAATVVGHFPLVLATGPGAGARNSIGIMLVSGMIVGTLFTLVVLPSIYMALARNHSLATAINTERELVLDSVPEGVGA